MAKKIFSLADRKKLVFGKLISKYFYVLFSPTENYQNYYYRVNDQIIIIKKTIYRKSEQNLGEKIKGEIEIKFV